MLYAASSGTVYRPSQSGIKHAAWTHGQSKNVFLFLSDIPYEGWTYLHSSGGLIILKIFAARNFFVFVQANKRFLRFAEFVECNSGLKELIQAAQSDEGDDTKNGATLLVPSNAAFDVRINILLVLLSELGASLFEIAQSLFALERTFILGAMALNKNKSEERQANWQNPNSERFAHERYKDKRAQ